MNGSRRFRDRLTLTILHKLTYINRVANTSGVRAGETLRFYISNVSRWMERTTITKTLKCMFCGVPPPDLSRNVDITHRGVLTWISDSSSRQKYVSFSGSVFRTYVAENAIVCWCYLMPFMFICSYVVLLIDIFIHIHIEGGDTNIYGVIGIILLAISPNLPGWAIIEKRNTSKVRRKSAHFWSVGAENMW